MAYGMETSKGTRSTFGAASTYTGNRRPEKTENAIRSFDMGKEAREAYEAQVQLLKAQGMLLNYNTPLFQIPSEHALYRRWESYQEANGLEPKVSLYELRHTFVSVESSVLTDSQLKMLVGHSKNMDTAGVYRHELDGQREDLAAATTAAFKNGTGLTLVTVLVTLFFCKRANYMGYKPTPPTFSASCLCSASKNNTE